MKSRNYDKVEKLFQKCLMKILNIDLWKCYLTYVRETKSGLSSYRYIAVCHSPLLLSIIALNFGQKLQYAVLDYFMLGNFTNLQQNL